MNGAAYSYEMESEIRGYHVYASSWKPMIIMKSCLNRVILK